MLEKLCTPAIVYLGFSIVQILIDTFKGMYNAAFLKTLVMVVMTLILNILCNRELTVIAWLIVFIPFILMTYISSLLLFVFGLNPNKDAQDYEVIYPEENVVRKSTTSIVKTSSPYTSDSSTNSTTNSTTNSSTDNNNTTADDYDPNDYTSGTPSDINNYN